MVDTDLFSCLTIFCCSCISFIVILSLPIVEIVFGILYFNQINCISDVGVSLDIWLIVKGSTSILTICTVGTVLYLQSIFTLPCIYLFQLFNLAWLILGSVIFWRYCSNLIPDSINILMYVSLILGYISFLYSLKHSNSNTEKNNRPLLNV